VLLHPQHLVGAQVTVVGQLAQAQRRDAASEISASEKKALAAISRAMSSRLWVRDMARNSCMEFTGPVPRCPTA
jgi:post-segregation antitoxin (ccd killing protein)